MMHASAGLALQPNSGTHHALPHASDPCLRRKQPSGVRRQRCRPVEATSASPAQARRRALRPVGEGQSRSQLRSFARCSFSRVARFLRAAFCASSLRRAISFLSSLTAASDVDRPGPGLFGSTTGAHSSLCSLEVGHGRMREQDTRRWSCITQSTLGPRQPGSHPYGSLIANLGRTHGGGQP